MFLLTQTKEERIIAMYNNKVLVVCVMAFLGLAFASQTVLAQEDRPNDRWELAWASEFQVKEGTTELAPDLPAPWRAHLHMAWYDFDGDGNKEWFHEDNNYVRTYVYENSGDNEWTFAWFTDYVDESGANLYGSSDRGIVGLDLDGDGADELIHIHTTPGPDDPNHIPPIRVFKHEAGSDELLPEDWIVEWDDCPTGYEDGRLLMEYYNNAGDWDNDGNGEFGMNYKGDPLYYFAVCEVTWADDPANVVFEVEHMIEKGDRTTNAPARIEGCDFDNDGYDELYLPGRSGVVSDVFYLDCTGEDSWVEYYWGPEDPWVVPTDSIGYASSYCFSDLDGDGTKEIITLTKDNNVARGRETWLWITTVHPEDPANFMTAADWHRVQKIADIDALQPYLVDPENTSISYGFIRPGDADDDGYPDLYFAMDQEASCVLVNAEFMGGDYTNGTNWNYYVIGRPAEAAGVEDITARIKGELGGVGFGDNDLKMDLWHGNSRETTTPRPAFYVWEYQPVPVEGDNNNDLWELAWASEFQVKEGTTELAPDLPAPWRAHLHMAWYDFDGDGNKEWFHEDNNYVRTYVYENSGDNEWTFAWFTDYVDESGANLYGSSDRGIVGLDLDGDGADELIHIHTTPGPDDPNHIPPIRVFKHEAGSDELLPEDWIVEWDDCPTGYEDGRLLMEYYNNAGDWDNDGNGEFGMNYKGDPLYYFAVCEVTWADDPANVVFEVEHMIEKGDRTTNAPARIEGCDFDNDGYDELYLPGRSGVVSDVFYLDCTGEDSWVEYYWGPEDPWVVPTDSIGYASSYCFSDLDGDGTKEIITLTKDNNVARGRETWLWITTVHPEDPANFMTAADWHRVQKIADIDALQPYLVDPENTSISYGFIRPGDADDDGYPDLYFAMDQEASCVLVNAEFMGGDYTNGTNWNYYVIGRPAEAAGVEDITARIKGELGGVGFGDNDLKMDLWHGNSRETTTPRPAFYVWEYPVPVTSVENKLKADNAVPASFQLYQNFPNPFNPTTTISYYLDKKTNVELKIYNVQGRLVKTMVNAVEAKGDHNVVWDGTNTNGTPVSTGIYFYSLITKNSKQVRKMLLTR